MHSLKFFHDEKMRRLLPLAGLFLLLLSCEAIFTQSPLEAFARDPSLLPPAQKIAFAEDALASGDPAAISEAYDTIKDYLEDADLDGDEAVEVNTLAVELLAADSAEMQAYMDAIIDNGGEPSATQALVAATVVLTPLLDAYLQPDGTLDVNGSDNFDAGYATMTPSEQAAFDAASAYINLAIADLGADSAEGERLYGLTDLFGMGVNPN